MNFGIYDTIVKSCHLLNTRIDVFSFSIPGLIDAIESAAEKEIPIFNIGLDSWFNIFGPANWKNQQLRLKLMNSLARLNQTPDTTLDPAHNNFRGLVKGFFFFLKPVFPIVQKTFTYLSEETIS